MKGEEVNWIPNQRLLGGGGGWNGLVGDRMLEEALEEVSLCKTMEIYY